MLAHVAVLLAAAAAPGDWTRSWAVTDGVLSDGTAVGQYTSQLQRAVVGNAAYFPAVTAEQLAYPYQNASSTLRYLYLTGDYLMDTPLRLPSCFILVLDGTLTLAANVSYAHTARASAAVVLNGTTFSGMTGGRVEMWNAKQAVGVYAYGGVSMLNAHASTVRGVRCLSNNTEACVSVHGGSRNDVVGCDVGGSAERMCASRCIWALGTTKVYVHGNHVHHCTMHALDFDAYTSKSVAHSNLCEDNGAEGIFVEETASLNVVYNNTCRGNKNGIGVYTLDVGPVQDNAFIGNAVAGNADYGITAGGFGHGTEKASKNNVFIANVGGPFFLNHGANQGDYWTRNDGEMVVSEWEALSGLSVFNP